MSIWLLLFQFFSDSTISSTILVLKFYQDEVKPIDDFNESSIHISVLYILH